MDRNSRDWCPGIGADVSRPAKEIGTASSSRRFLPEWERKKTMLGYALIFLLLALVAGSLGFFGLAGLAATIAKVLLIVSAFSGALRGRPPV